MLLTDVMHQNSLYKVALEHKMLMFVQTTHALFSGTSIPPYSAAEKMLEA